MKTHCLLLLGRPFALLILLATEMHLVGAPLGTAFTYQGRLSDGGDPATGIYDLRFTIYDLATDGTAAGGPITNAPTAISNGLFTVTLGFGSGVFDGSARWLEIAVRTNGSSFTHTILTPRQPLTPAPYALFAPTAATANSVPWSALTGIPAGFVDGTDNDTTYIAGVGLTLSGSTFSIGPLGVTSSMLADNAITAAKIGNGHVVKSLMGLTDHVTLSPGPNVLITPDPGGNEIQISALPSGWSLTGNAGTTDANFLGTTDSRPLEFKVGAARALRLEPHDASPNLLGGSLLNTANAGVRGATIGGGGDFSFADVLWNIVSDDFGTVSGGLANTAGNNSGSIGDAKYATVGGGNHNTASGIASTVPGGINNRAAGTASLAAGNRAKADHNGAFVWADSSGGDFSSSGADQFLIRASGGVGIGTSAPTKALDVRDGSGATGDGGGIHVGGTGANGDAKLINFGDGDYVHVGENGADDTLELKASRFFFSIGNVGIGTATPGVKLDVLGEARVSVLTITGGADVAEPFQMSTPDIPQGAVVVIDEKNPGRLTISDRAYDHRVAGIVSGANGVKPGLTLHQEGVLEGGQNVALSGRVYVLADAANGPIQPGDLLTTSSVPGHAMKVTDHGKAHGAILGKAMGSLSKGRGMVLVLVSLQ